ncbi:hypothetical protein AEA09_04955 [Lysinibacillus contaminans]|uniref:YhfM-like domain-containing protein n=1 Tax=Lysinibacillus contaminans TaxID=1293441 RepID=A0ABR5JZ78_9BACI|nr:hypothetical protein [Lysinibacillus contaminans]KOS67967.1 hypothetical protein AEA09_04955 [Lysinibacillus contaminans]
MKKIMLLVLTLSLISVFLMGCQSNDNNGFADEDLSKVSISKSSGFGKVNSDFYIVYEDKETLDIFKNAITNAVKLEGIADMEEPQFDLKVIYTDRNKQGYHLWVGEKGQKSTLMNVDDTHIRYSISEEITNQLIDLVK